MVHCSFAPNFVKLIGHFVNLVKNDTHFFFFLERSSPRTGVTCLLQQVLEKLWIGMSQSEQVELGEY